MSLELENEVLKHYIDDLTCSISDILNKYDLLYWNEEITYLTRNIFPPSKKNEKIKRFEFI